MTKHLSNEIERLRGLISLVKNFSSSDFLSPKYDSFNMLENQLIEVSLLASKEKLTAHEKLLVKRLILQGQFLLL